MVGTDVHIKTKRKGHMTHIKNIMLFLIMVSTLAGGIGQLIILNGTIAVYNAYFQLAFGFGLLLWLSHRVLSFYEKRHSKPIVNARDKK